MNKGRVVLCVVAVLVCVTIGFVVGQLVQAMNTLPGSSDDPVATQSYVETTVGERLADLSTKVEELEAEVSSLKGGTTTPSANNPTTTNSSTNNPGNNGGASSSGDTLTITGNSVNVRSAASTDATIIGSVQKGNTVTKLSAEGDWYRVRLTNGTVGYISSRYAQ